MDREALLVPSGWDSWGKIKVLREGFDPGKTLVGWREDLETRAAAPGPSANGVRQEYKAAVGAIGLVGSACPVLLILGCSQNRTEEAAFLSWRCAVGTHEAKRRIKPSGYPARAGFLPGTLRDTGARVYKTPNAELAESVLPAAAARRSISANPFKKDVGALAAIRRRQRGSRAGTAVLW